MITRSTIIATQTCVALTPPINPPSRLRLFAVGKFGPDCRELTAPSKVDSRTQAIEHRIVHFRADLWVAEVRANLRMTHHCIFRGPTAYNDAVAWCNAIAPHADTISLRFPNHARAVAVAPTVLAAEFAEAAL